MICFSLKITVKYGGLREDEQRLEKLVNYVIFMKAEPRLEKLVKDVPFEHQKTRFGGPSRAFSRKKPMFLFFLHHKKPVFNAVLEAKNVPQVIFDTPKARILRAFRTFPCLPRRIAKSTVFYGEITAFVGRKTRFFFFSPSKLD